jgi:alpha-mannosidase
VIEPKNNVCIQIFEDNPTEGRKQLDHLGDAIMSDAWEVYIYQQSKGVKYIKLTMPEKVEVLEYGPIRATVQVSFKYSQEKRPKSTITLYITLYSKIPLVYIKLKIDWHASHRLIKMLFPINLNSDYATYEIPYGFIMRRNPLSPEATLEERSKWEVPGQKWIDYSSSDANYGVSILNDCKYGFDQVNNVIRVTLLRSPSYPQNYPAEIDELLKEKELTDQGKHEVNLAIFPHKGDWREALTVKRAYEFNYPLIIQIEKQHFGKLPKEYSFIKVKPNNVILTSIKKAEDSDDIILRLYETDGKYADVTLTFDIKPIKVWETDLMENPLSELPVYGKNVRISVKPCEIKSIKVGYS